MAQVFRAHDVHLERDVALKVLRPHLTEADQERFRREIKALARLSHPGIVSIYDLGRGRHVYFVMELVEGGLFTDLGPFDPDLAGELQFLDAAIAVAETLAHVHQHTMVHRDLTPRNILMTSEGQPKLMDFGLVQLAETTRQLTRTGLTLGTPHYMAPEQASGGLTGAHTDLYALGAVLYRASTGVAPFEAENDQAVLYQHVYGEPKSPSDVNPYVPESLSALILQLLAKDPQARPTSGYRVAEALRTIRAEAETAGAKQRLGGPGQQGLLAHGPANPDQLRSIWTTKLGEGPQWPAALTVAGSFIIAGLRSEQVCVLHPADGTIITRFDADDEINSPVLYHQQQLIYTSRTGTLSALDWPKGSLRWRDPQAEAIGVTPYGNALAVTGAQGLELRDAAGSQQWRYECEMGAMSAPTLHREQAFFAARDGWLHCVDLRSGEGRFKIQVGAMTAQASAKNDVLFIPERAGSLHGLDLKRREVLWSYDLDGQLWASPVLWRDNLYAISWAGTVHCLNAQSGDDLWSCALDAKLTAAPIIASGVLYVVSERGEIVALDAHNGRQLARQQISSSAIQASPVTVQGTLVVAALDGTITAFR